MTDAEYRELVERSKAELSLKTTAHVEGWGLGSTESWAVDQSEGTLVFTAPDRVVTAPVQIVGTYSTTSKTWLWSWDNPSILRPLQEHARAVLAFGEKHLIAALTTRKIECDEQQAWEFAALACHLNGAQGAYRGPAGAALVFMTFGAVTLRKPDEA